MAILQVEHLRLTYQSEAGEVTALADVDFAMEEGEFCSVVGPSGCGKSTLLSIIAGMLPATGGRVLIGGEEVRGPSPRVGYMLQQDNLLEWRTVRQNVLFGLQVQRALTAESRARAERLLDTYGLAEFADRYPSELSGGMRQRVALIRTLAINPAILLLDEAFSALDYQTRLTVTEDVYSIIRQEGVTTLMVTHDIPESIGMADTVLVLSGRPAVVKDRLAVTFDMEGRTPLTCRSRPEFSRYFDYIWKELGMDETHTDAAGFGGTRAVPASE